MKWDKRGLEDRSRQGPGDSLLAEEPSGEDPNGKGEPAVGAWPQWQL